ncbi:Zn(2)-C6 fungal-type domain-containing protein [Mycena kentingensis (nom. inval.)]|nr:Zn(2)-C6 fungal-type domain-containing protein [Mycena kentingensis (nom. inval.)]
MFPDGPVFPPELETEVFTLAAYENRADIPRLRLVARRTCEWLERSFYESIKLACGHSDNHRLISIRDALHSKPPGFTAQIVRHASVQATRPNAGAQLWPLLLLCPGLTHLALNINSVAGIPSEDILSRLPNIRRIVVIPDELFCRTHQLADFYVSGFFNHLTHFTFLPSGQKLISERAAAFICALPAMTHLAIHHTNATRWAPDFLAQCPALRVLCLIAWTDRVGHVPEVLARIDLSVDPRLCVAGYRTWNEGASLHERCFWDVADECIAARKAG